jgi:hypothetical protein
MDLRMIYHRRDGDGHEYFELDGRKFYFKRNNDGAASPQCLRAPPPRFSFIRP